MAEISIQRVEAMRQELNDLSQLNAAMFRQIFSGDSIEKGLFAARYDKTNPEADRCLAERGWDLRIEGDFFLVKHVHDSIYIIVGDATGHHAYAGALKVFVAAALQNLFDSFAKKKREPTASRVLKELHAFFLKVGEAALVEDSSRPLQHGVDAIVIRIRPEARAVTCASAGLPLFQVGPKDIARIGDFNDQNGINFPSSLESAEPFDPKDIPLDVRETRFLAVVTDGFQDLRRIVSGNPQSFGVAGIRTALQSAVPQCEIRQSRGQFPAAVVASTLVAAAKAFREGYMIPEETDDDRLAVVVDLRAAWA